MLETDNELFQRLFCGRGGVSPQYVEEHQSVIENRMALDLPVPIPLCKSPALEVDQFARAQRRGEAYDLKSFGILTAPQSRDRIREILVMRAESAAIFLGSVSPMYATIAGNTLPNVFGGLPFGRVNDSRPDLENSAYGYSGKRSFRSFFSLLKRRWQQMSAQARVIFCDINDFYPSVSSLRMKECLDNLGDEFNHLARVAASFVGRQDCSRGLPIDILGEASSILGNVYLHPLDRAIKSQLSRNVTYWLRFVDDFVFGVDSDADVRTLSERIEATFAGHGLSIKGEKFQVFDREDLGYHYCFDLMDHLDRSDIETATQQLQKLSTGMTPKRFGTALRVWIMLSSLHSTPPKGYMTLVEFILQDKFLPYALSHQQLLSLMWLTRSEQHVWDRLIEMFIQSGHTLPLANVHWCVDKLVTLSSEGQPQRACVASYIAGLQNQVLDLGFTRSRAA